MEEQKKSKFARRYDREFKESAVALVQSGRSVSEVARDLDVSQWAVGRWVQKAREGNAQSQPKRLEVETAEGREQKLRVADPRSVGWRALLTGSRGSGGW